MGIKHAPLKTPVEKYSTNGVTVELTKKTLAFLFFVVFLMLLSLCLCIHYENDLKTFINHEVTETEESALAQLIKQYRSKNSRDELMDSQQILHSRKKRQLLQMSMNFPDCKRISNHCDVLLRGIKDVNTAFQLRMNLEALGKNLVQQGVLKDGDDMRNERLLAVSQCLQCQNIIRPNFPSPFDLTPLNRNQYNADEGKLGTYPRTVVTEVVKNNTKFLNGHRITTIVRNRTIVEEENATLTPQNRNRYENNFYAGKERAGEQPAAIVQETVSNNTKMLNGQKITTIVHNTTIVEKEDSPAANANAGTHVPWSAGETAPVTPASIMENTKQYSRIEVDPHQQNIPVCFYGPATTSAPVLDQSSYQYIYQQPPIYPSQDANAGYAQGNSPTTYYYPNNPQYQSAVQNEQIPNGESQVYCFSIPASANDQLQESDPSKYLQSNPREIVSSAANNEIDANGECRNGKIRCRIFDKCIYQWQVCDKKYDCPLGDDELNCRGNGKSTADNEVDSNFHQPSNTNSQNAPRPTTEATPMNAVTNYAILPEMPEQFMCKKIIQTIPIEKRCDNVYDCQDATDEKNCTCKDYLKREHASAICDGHVDCYDGSDENDCGNCRDDQYLCHRSNSCIPNYKRCDQVTDCRFDEDESDCYALTDGTHINFDMDKRPHLNLEGIFSRFINGGWYPICFDSNESNDFMQYNAGQIVCENLGLKDIESAQRTLVQTSQLIEKTKSKDRELNYEYMLRIPHTPENSSGTCYGLKIRCKPILDQKLEDLTSINPKTNKRNYLWPWEASIFVDGKYHCPALLLENDLLLSSYECGKEIDPRKNYTNALLGVASSNLPFAGPYQQMSQIVGVKFIKNSDASLFHLRDNINMTRYVQPIYLEKRIFPASKNDTCIAIGANKRHERKMMFLEPVVDVCSKCHRCYKEQDGTSSCLMNNNDTMKWNGYVVCRSDGGWYPAAVFHDKDENCGFRTMQMLDGIDYLHAHLYDAIDSKFNATEEASCNGMRCSLGKCVPWENVCDGLRDCPDGLDESPKQCEKMKNRCQDNIFECKCTKSELRCGNGKCVPKEKFCDGVQDCGDGSDEPKNCTCGEYLKLTEPKLVCDGRQHCMDKSDEKYQDCTCKDSSFKCQKSQYKGAAACIPQDFVCDGILDCPYGEDEAENVCWSIRTSNDRDPKSKGEVMRRTNGVLHSECFPRPVRDQSEINNVCSKLGYRSGFYLDSTKTSDLLYVPRNDFYMFQLNNYTWMSMRPDTSYGAWVKPDQTCYRLFVYCN